MITFTRPSVPTWWDAATDTARRDVERVVSQGKEPCEKDFAQGPWQDLRVKAAFSKAQGRMVCAWCGVKMTESHGQIDHFQPKSSVSRGVITPGNEKDHINNNKSGQNEPDQKPGWWWLAYRWDNYLLVCGMCNRWKSTLFPTTHQGQRIKGPASMFGGCEEPLLLNPADPNLDLTEHFTHSTTGKPIGLTAKGKETIKVLGLDLRVTLSEVWREFMETVNDYLEDYQGAHPTTRSRAAKRLLRHATPPKEHYRVARCVIRQELGPHRPWADLEAELKAALHVPPIP